jgi:RNA polymerase sigma factor (sigma-70 family)
MEKAGRADSTFPLSILNFPLVVYLSALPTSVQNSVMKETSTQRTSAIESELRQLYKRWPDAKRFLRTLGCTGTDAEDLFQEALVIFVRKREQADFELTVDAYFYVRNTCKLLWYNQSRKQGKQQTYSLETDVAQLEDDWFRKETQIRVIEEALTRLGKQCQELLQLFYGLGWNMSEIAQKIGLRNDKVAKVQKYRCLQKAKELVRENGNAEALHVELQNLVP